MTVEFKGNSIIEHTDAIRGEFIELGKYQQNTRSINEVVVDCSADLNAAERKTMTDLGATVGCDSVTFI